MTAIPDPQPLDPSDGVLVEGRLGRVAAPTCDLTFAALTIWRDCEAPSWVVSGGTLCLVIDAHHEGRFCLEPLAEDGTGDVAALEACIATVGRASRVRAEVAARLDPARFDVAPLRDHFDYVYAVRDLAELRGREHDGKRNRIRKFQREHPRHEFRELTRDDGPAALRLFDRWGAEHADEPEAAATPGRAAPVLPSRACQRRALGRAFEGFDRLRLTGGAIVEDGEMFGFLVASRTAAGATAHFEYADAGAQGVYQTLLQETCRQVLAPAGDAIVNLEEDLGLPGLRRTKLSYEPKALVEKYDVTPRVRAS